MPNYAKTTVIFQGNQSTLNRLEKDIIIPSQGRWKGQFELNYAALKDLIPALEDKDIFKLVGCNYDEYLFAGYQGHSMTKEQALEWDEKVDTFVKSNGWIGLAGSYRNERIQELAFNYVDENTFKMMMTFSWYCPFEFFRYHATKNDVRVTVLEELEGNYNQLMFWDEAQNDYDFGCHSPTLLLENDNFRRATLRTGLFVPEQIYLLAMYRDNQEVMNQFSHVEPANVSQWAGREAEMLGEGEYLKSIFNGYKEVDDEQCLSWLEEVAGKKHNPMEEFSKLGASKNGLGKINR